MGSNSVDKMIYLAILNAIVIAIQGESADEAHCVQMSRFDYEYRMLQTITKTELENGELQEKVGKCESQINELGVQMSYYEGLERRVALLESLHVTGQMSDTGTTYIRWGRTTCPDNGTDLLYSGYVGGSLHTHKGGAANQLCLPKEPIWGHYRTDWRSGAKLYGGEYEFEEHVSKSDEFLGQDLNDKFAVCSVCVSSRPRLVMIPGRTSCYDGWTKEYSGYLSADKYDHASATEYVCMDRRPEFHTDGKQSTNGALFYFVEAVCGTLPCPPYVEGREITCVVCTK